MLICMYGLLSVHVRVPRVRMNLFMYVLNFVYMMKIVLQELVRKAFDWDCYFYVSVKEYI